MLIQISISLGSCSVMPTLRRICLRRINKIQKPTRFLATVSNKSEDVRHVDTLIIGGGVMGASTAYHLAQMRLGSPSITVVERDVSYQNASSSLSAGGIRQQFSLKENIQMTLYGRDFLRDAHNLLSTSEHECDVSFQEHGYLFLTSSEKGAQQMKENNQLQRSLGCDIRLLAPEELRASPCYGSWLCGDLSDVTMASYSQSGGGEGYFDPWALRCGFQRKAIELGANFVSGEAVRATVDPKTSTVTSVQVLQPHGNTITYHVKNVVNAAGPLASKVMDMLAADLSLENSLPVRPRKRSIFFFQCHDNQQADEIPLPPFDTPLTIDADAGVYFRPEGKSFLSGKRIYLCGVSPPPEDDIDCDGVADELQVVHHESFENVIWPHLYRRIPAFGSLKVHSFWAGFYDYNTVDQNAILGAHPERPNLYLINGFSGHGVQQSPAAGRAIAELIQHNGQYQTLDLSIFPFDRFIPGGRGAVSEAGIV